MTKPGAGGRQKVLLQPDGVEKMSLPIAVQTILIEGKRITPAFYKQLTEKSVINADTGELCGIPLGYFHLHTKECPPVKHTHVLWGKETQLHLATVTDLQHDEHYQKQSRLNGQREKDLPRDAQRVFYQSKQVKKLAKDQRNVTPCKGMLLRVIFLQGGHQPV